MNTCFFVSDLHGKMSRYEALFKFIKREKPDFVFLGGDLLPHTNTRQNNNTVADGDFVKDFLFRKFDLLKEKMDCTYPEVFLIPGNDDHKILLEAVADGEKADLWRNLHNQCVVIGKYRFYGYACVPPTPFLIKDWDRFDISKEMEPGCIAPADGYHSVPSGPDPENESIKQDLQVLIKDDDMKYSVFLFHSPPYQTLLDQAVINNEIFIERPSVVNAGSKAIRGLIDESQPYITMHGHIHESARISGQWKQSLGRTMSFSAAHDGPELALIKFDLQDVLSATRRLIKV